MGAAYRDQPPLRPRRSPIPDVPPQGHRHRRRERPRGCRPGRYRRGAATGKGARPLRVGAGGRPRLQDQGDERLRRHGGLRHRRGHLRPGPPAGHEPRRPAGEERREPGERGLGMAGVLDSARFRTFIAWELGVSVTSTHAFVLGGHGDTMVPLPRYSTVAGIPLPHLLSPERIEALVDRTRNGGAEVVALLKSGSAYYAPAAAVAQMVGAILGDTKAVLPCTALLQGEYRTEGLFVGVPVKLGRGGMEGIVQIELTEAEQAAFDRSAAAVRELVDKLAAA